MRSNILYALSILFSVILSGCCGDSPSIDRVSIHAISITENRKGYFSLTKLQLTQPGITGGQWKPLSLASSDLDKDGIPDLVSGFQNDSGGLLSVQFGDVNFAYSRRKPAITDSPFIAESQLLDLPVRPDYIFCGDFNHDQFTDILIGQNNTSFLYLIAGDQKSEFTHGNFIPLPGNITAMHVTQLYGKAASDVILGLQTTEGYQMLIYKGKNQIAFTQPEVYPFAKRIDAFETGFLNSDSAKDVVILTQGRLFTLMADQKLKSSQNQKPKLVRFQPRLKDFAIGRFVEGGKSSLVVLSESGKLSALTFVEGSNWQKKAIVRSARPGAIKILRTRMTGAPLDDLAIISGKQVQLLSVVSSRKIYEPVDSFDLSSSFADALSIQLNRDALEDLVLLEDADPITIAMSQSHITFFVTLLTDESDANTSDDRCDIDLVTSGDQCTFRAAIQQSNATAGVDDIDFTALSNPTITPVNPLPSITDPVNINPFGDDLVELSGSNPTAAFSHGLHITAGSSRVERLVINQFNGSALAAGIALEINGDNDIVECRIGTDRTGTIDLGNSYGILINGSSGNEIGGFLNANQISGNIIGVGIQGNSSQQNSISYNLIGTTADGSGALGNTGDGVYVTTPQGNSNFIQNNTISANGGNGIRIHFDGYIADNKIGVNSAGNADLGNTGLGVSIVLDSNYVYNNVISGNGSAGISILGDDNRIESNFIGTDELNNLSLGNGAGGILIQDANQNWVEENTIANNTGFLGAGIRVIGESGSVENTFTENNIYANSGIGIDLGGTGVTANDNGDADSGPNRLQNFPVITSATSDGNVLGVSGTLNSLPSETFFIEIFAGIDCDSSGNGEGQVFVGDFTLFTDASGNGSFSETMPHTLPAAQFVTATASRIISTNPAIHETSEFSACFQIEGPTSGFKCNVYGPLSPMPGEDVFGFGEVTDFNNVPVANLPVLFRIQGPFGEDQIAAATTDANGQAQSPIFSSLYPVEYTLTMQGDGFSCNTTVEFSYCDSFNSVESYLSLPTRDKNQLWTIKNSDAELSRNTDALVLELKAQFKNGTLQLTQTQLQELIYLIDRYSAKADPRLQHKLFQIRSKLSDPRFLQEQNIFVTDKP